MTKQVVRIIGGTYRGKKLPFPDASGLRPTPDRVRETLFNWLMHTIRGARCLDAFAGSGALGLEAFSRGAASVVFLEENPAVFRNLLTQAKNFNAPTQLSVKHVNALTYLTEQREPFDIIFLDPPFASDLLEKALTLLINSPLLAEEGLVYTESNIEATPDPTLWQPIKSKKAGQVVYSLYKKAVSS